MFNMMENKIMCFTLLAFITIVKGSIPGTFFWKPRLGIDFNYPKTEPWFKVYPPTDENIRAGLVVLIEGYAVGMTLIAFASGIGSAEPFLHLNPVTAYYHTNVYRWALRYFSLVPFWLSGTGGNFCESHKVWLRRFYYMDQFMPTWMRKAFPYVKKDEWSKEEGEFVRFKKYAETAFGKHFKYPDKLFTNYRSEQTEETVENLDESSKSLSE